MESDRLTAKDWIPAAWLPDLFRKDCNETFDRRFGQRMRSRRNDLPFGLYMTYQNVTTSMAATYAVLVPALLALEYFAK